MVVRSSEAPPAARMPDEERSVLSGGRECGEPNRELHLVSRGGRGGARGREQEEYRATDGNVHGLPRRAMST